MLFLSAGLRAWTLCALIGGAGRAGRNGGDGGLEVTVTPDRAREMALALPDVTEAPHFHRLAFRTPRKMFATLDAAVPDLNLLFDPDLRDFYCEQAPHAFTAVPGGWGVRGATCCRLASVDEATLESALRAAHRLAAPIGRRRR